MTITTVPSSVPDLLGTAPADLIDQRADQPAATNEVAIRRAERIRTGLSSYAAMRQDIADAYAQRDWRALDYDSWHAYLEGEFGEELHRLKRAERPVAVRDLRAQGMSMPQIANAVGVGVGTVHRDLAAGFPDGKAAPEKVTGSDGKQHPATKPERPTPAAEPMPARQDVADRIVAGIDQHAVLPGAATTVTPVEQVPVGPERPKPPAWDPAERAEHEASVRRRQDIEAAHRQAKTLVPDVRSHIFTVLAGYRLGEKHLITRDTIADLRRDLDLLEKELDGED